MYKAKISQAVFLTDGSEREGESTTNSTPTTRAITQKESVCVGSEGVEELEVSKDIYKHLNQKKKI